MTVLDNMKKDEDGYIIKPDPDHVLTTRDSEALDCFGNPVHVPLVTERPLTVFLNNREIVTLMTLGDYPEFLGVGYLVNQKMLKKEDVITGIDYDAEIDVVVVRTQEITNYEKKLKRKILTSGCGMGTVFGDVMDNIDGAVIGEGITLEASWLAPLLKTIKKTPSLYQKAGSIHACVLCKDQQPLIYMEDVARHNALDKVAGYLYLKGMSGSQYYIYTTGRMTSEMVMKAVSMGVSVLISRSGATKWGVDLARKVGLTLISRAKGKRFIVLSAPERVRFDRASVKKQAAE